ncbi:MAG: hypothetical protein IT287_04960 [Bdellovibrionaceae bacterium]|nr:hypothetical protein [Pseudobdellovibrionaceae bacterium]
MLIKLGTLFALMIFDVQEAATVSQVEDHMTKKLIIAIALTSVAVSACGSKNSYKAARLSNKMTLVDPATVNEVADGTIEERAEKALLSDEHHMMYRASTLSVMMKEELLGASGQISAVGEKSKIEVSLLDSRAQECKEKSGSVEVDSKKRNETNQINNLARVRCVDTSCDHLLVFIETRRSVKNEEFGGSSILNGTVAVLLKKDESGAHKPLTTQSKNFFQVNSTDIAVQSCIEVASRPQTGDEFAVQREKEKNSPDEASARPQTGDEFAVQRLQQQQDARIKAIDERIKAIDARFKELSSGTSLTDEPKALATEKAKLQKERESILNARTVVPESKMEPVDPTL